MASYRHILTQSSNGVFTITLNRPEKRNALSPEMMDELTAALQEAAADDSGVVILTGTGPAFCAGLDMEHLAAAREHKAEEASHDAEKMAHLLRALYEFPKPVIAAVNGSAIAGGLGLVTMADFALAVPEAKFGFTEVKVGFVPAIVATFLIRHLGERKTRELLLSGRLLKVQEALQYGLITQIVPTTEELPQTAEALAHQLLQNSPQAMREVKRLLAAHAQQRLDHELEEAVQAAATYRSAEDFREGVEAFLQRRRPEWPSLQAKV